MPRAVKAKRSGLPRGGALSAQPYPPPPPPPPPPANNPYYQRFFEEYWSKNSEQAGGGVGGAPPPPPPTPAVPHTTRPTVSVAGFDPAESSASGPDDEYPVKTDRATFVLGHPDDVDQLSEKQCYVRTRMCELFLAEETDVQNSVRGRRAAFVGQVGLRCVFCVPKMYPRERLERAICYPTTVTKIYQTVQDMQHFHFGLCRAVPPKVREVYKRMKSGMNKRRAAFPGKISPKDYWAKVGKDMGMIEAVGDDGNTLGIKLREGHTFVSRTVLPGYAEKLFLPPSEGGGLGVGGGARDGAMATLLAKEVEVDEGGGGEGGFEELVKDLDQKGDTTGDGEGSDEEVDEPAGVGAEEEASGAEEAEQGQDAEVGDDVQDEASV